ncbi:hypothetical protein D7V86_23170 [bacterium D16-51]|nr:hypothetical protein D7V96_17560 [bacterium D16-59]RKI54596.1 hypothetical protein D7V86_23170 [bacterium D16-51]
MHKDYIIPAIPKILPYGSCMGTLVLEPCFLRVYAPLRFPSKRKRGAIGKILELPRAVNLCNI